MDPENDAYYAGLGEVIEGSQGGTPKTLLGRFPIGSYFGCGGKTWRVTDVGTRTVIAIEHVPDWMVGPPYELAETVFDEDDQVVMTPTSGPPAAPETVEEKIDEVARIYAPADLSPEEKAAFEADVTFLYRTHEGEPPGIEGDGPLPALQVRYLAAQDHPILPFLAEKNDFFVWSEIRRLAQEVVRARWYAVARRLRRRSP